MYSTLLGGAWSEVLGRISAGGCFTVFFGILEESQQIKLQLLTCPGSRHTSELIKALQNPLSVFGLAKLPEVCPGADGLRVRLAVSCARMQRTVANHTAYRRPPYSARGVVGMQGLQGRLLRAPAQRQAARPSLQYTARCMVSQQSRGGDDQDKSWGEIAGKHR